MFESGRAASTAAQAVKAANFRAKLAGRSSAPMRDFGATRTGWEAPISGPQLYAHLFSEVSEVCGVPAALVNPSSAGPAAREAWRRLTVGTIEPYARLLESELSRVLDRTVVIKLRRLGGVDAASRAAGGCMC